MVAGQDKSDTDDDADDKADHKKKAGGVADGTLAQIENSGRLILVHILNLHLRVPRTTGDTRALFFRRMRAIIRPSRNAAQHPE